MCIRDRRYSIQWAGFTNWAMVSGVSEMIARIMVSLYAVPALGYLAVCFGDPTAVSYTHLPDNSLRFDA